MKHAKEIVRLKEGGATYREIAAILHCSQAKVAEAVKAAREKGLAYGSLADKDDETVCQLLFAPQARECGYYLPDWAGIDRKLREKGVNLSLAW